jgi:hypothetical protein
VDQQPGAQTGSLRESATDLRRAAADRYSGRREGVFRVGREAQEHSFYELARGDRTYAQHVADLLLQHFESVFYYGEPEALPHGGPWRDGLYETLAQAGVGVPILSTNYDNSNYCQEEARFMADLVTNKKMAAFPILLGDCTTKTFSQLQYRRTDRMSPKDIVDGIVKEVRERKL